MRILHVIDSGGLYGAEHMLLDLAWEQQRMGLKPLIASIGGKRAGEKEIERAAFVRGVPVHPFRMRSGPNFPGAVEILRFAWQERIHLLHSHGYKGNFLFGTIPRRCRRLPLVTTVHGYTSLQRASRMKIYEWVDARLLNLLDAVVLVDASVRRHPRMAAVSTDRFEVIPNGIGPASSADRPPLPPEVEAFCRGGVPMIGAVGRLAPEKCFHLLLEAFAQLCRGGLDCRLLLIGEGRGREELVSRAKRLKVADRVLLPGFIIGVRHHLPLLSAFVISSATEGLPISLLEAMQARVAVVSTRVGAIPEVLENGRAGLLVAPGDAEELAAALERLLTEPGLAAGMIERAAARVQNLYSSRRMAESYKAIYCRVLNGGGAAHA